MLAHPTLDRLAMIGICPRWVEPHARIAANPNRRHPREPVALSIYPASPILALVLTLAFIC